VTCSWAPVQGGHPGDEQADDDPDKGTDDAGIVVEVKTALPPRTLDLPLPAGRGDA